MTSAEDNWSPDDVTPDAEGPRRRQVGVVGVVLAGGASRRMGGRAKALLPWPPQAPTTTFLGSICEALDAGGVGPIVVVTGTHHDAIAAARPPSVAAVRFNPAHAEGQLTSLWAGVEWAEGLAAPPDWLAVALVDAPGIAAATVRQLSSAARHAPRDPSLGRPPVIVRPVFEGRHGHPVLWHRDAWPLMRACSVQLGARAAVRALAAQGRVLDVEVDDPAVVRDVDTAADYRALDPGASTT